MGRGAIIRTVSIAVLQPVVLAGTPQQSMAVTAIRQAPGASTVIRSIAEAKPAPAAARLPTTMLTIRIATVRGFRTMRCGISVPRRALPAETPVMSMPTMWIPMAMANATIAARLSP